MTFVPDPHWRDKAKCHDMDPELFDEDKLPGTTEAEKDEAAFRLCEGCPVMADCYFDADMPIHMTRVCLGTDLEWREESQKYEPDIVPTSGIVRGGAILRTGDVFPDLRNAAGRHDRSIGWGREA